MRRVAFFFAVVLTVAVLTACGAMPARIVVQWTTATEMNTAGFNLYRSERAEGPFVKINAQPIPASTNPMIGGEYRYEDTDVVAGRTYYYQLEDIEFSGVSTRHGPIDITAPAMFSGDGALMWLAVLVGALVLLIAVLGFVRRNALCARDTGAGEKQRAFRE